MVAPPKRIASRAINCLAAGLIGAAAQASAAPASATRLTIRGIVVSANPTRGVICIAHICRATAVNAVLNVTMLQNLLAESDINVTTDGTTQDIDIAAPLTWISGHALTLDARRSIEIDRRVSVAGGGGLTLVTNDGGTNGALAFGSGGNVNFWSLSSPLSIDGAAYTLVDDIATLASGIAAHPHRNYALSRSIDSTVHYTSTPVATPFSGTFEGLGNTISGLSIFDLSGSADALFVYLDHPGVLRDIGLINVSIKNANSNGFGRAGALAAQNAGAILGAYATGNVGCDDRFFACIAGGLIAINYGRVGNSWAAIAVEAGEESQDGGLIGNNHGDIANCFATGSVAAFQGADEGGLIGYNIGRAAITNTYASGAVSGDGADLGGLIGYSWESSKISSSYASGAVGGGAYNGGLIGYDVKQRHLSATYWDTTSSGIPSASQGAGNPGNDPGITGLTDAQLKSGLPADFSDLIWASNPSVNGGLPYLIATPPR